MAAYTRIIGSVRTHSVLVIIVFVGVLYALTIRPGLPWGDDFAMYLMHARNLATGMPYTATGYVFNPAQPEVGPPSYPPLFPTIIAPAVAIAGFNTYLLKGEVAFCFLAALCVIYRYVRRQVPEPYAAGIVAVIGFSPYCWQLRDNIASDIPFLLLLFLTYDRVAESDRRQWKSVGSAIGVGLLVYLCFACRFAGIAILPSLVAFELIQQRGFPRRGVWISAAIASAGMILQVLMLRSKTPRNDQFGAIGGWAIQGVGLTRGVTLQHFREYVWSLRHDWFHLGGIAGWVVLATVGLLGLVGYLLVVKRALSAMEVFVAAYATMIALWAADQDLRFLLPLIPLWLMYASVAVVRLGGLGFKRISYGLSIGAMLVFAASDVNYFLHAQYGRTPGGTNDQGFVSIAHFVDEATPADATIIFSKPRLLALVSNRKSAVYPLNGGADEVIRYSRRIGATYVLAGDPFENDRRVLSPILAAHPDVFDLIFQTPGFRLYRLRDEPPRAG